MEFDKYCVNINDFHAFILDLTISEGHLYILGNGSVRRIASCQFKPDGKTQYEYLHILGDHKSAKDFLMEIEDKFGNLPEFRINKYR